MPFSKPVSCPRIRGDRPRILSGVRRSATESDVVSARGDRPYSRTRSGGRRQGSFAKHLIRLAHGRRIGFPRNRTNGFTGRWLENVLRSPGLYGLYGLCGHLVPP